MTTHTFLLSNLSYGSWIDLSVAEGHDVLAAARSHLAESGLPEDVQRGFFLSVYPTVSEAVEDTPVGNTAVGDTAVGDTAVVADAVWDDAVGDIAVVADAVWDDARGDADVEGDAAVEGDAPVEVNAVERAPVASEGVSAAVDVDSASEDATVAAPDDATVGQSPLAVAAAQGPLNWTDDPEVDPPGTPEPLQAASIQPPTGYFGVPIGSAGGH